MKHYPPSQNKGILKTAVGYTGGKNSSVNPSYTDVCAGTSEHAEALRIEFDPSVVTYGELVGECYANRSGGSAHASSFRNWRIAEFFYRTHDPTTVNRQGADTGTRASWGLGDRMTP